MTKCEIDGCFHEVAEDSRCAEHGGHPAVESHTDIYGHTDWNVHVFYVESEGQPKWTSSTESLFLSSD